MACRAAWHATAHDRPTYPPNLTNLRTLRLSLGNSARKQPRAAFAHEDKIKLYRLVLAMGIIVVSPFAKAPHLALASTNINSIGLSFLAELESGYPQIDPRSKPQHLLCH